MNKIMMAFFGLMFVLSAQTVVAATNNVAATLQQVYLLLLDEDLRTLKNDLIYNQAITECSSNQVAVVTDDSGLGDFFRDTPMAFDILIGGDANGVGATVHQSDSVLLEPGVSYRNIYPPVMTAGDVSVDLRIRVGSTVSDVLCSTELPDPAINNMVTYDYDVIECSDLQSVVKISDTWPDNEVRSLPQDYDLIYGPEDPYTVLDSGSVLLGRNESVERTHPPLPDGEQLRVRFEIPSIGTHVSDVLCTSPPAVNDLLEYVYSIPTADFAGGVKVLVEDLYGPFYDEVRSPDASEFAELWKDLVFNPDGTYKSGTLLHSFESLALPFAGNAIYSFPGVVGGGMLSIRVVGYPEEAFLNLIEAPAPTPNDELRYEFTGVCTLNSDGVSRQVSLTVGDTDPVFGGMVSNEERITPVYWRLIRWDVAGNGSEVFTGDILLTVGEVRAGYDFIVLSSGQFATGDRIEIFQNFKPDGEETIEICTMP